MKRVLALLLLAAACRTPVVAKPKEAETEKDVYVAQECNIRDYPSVGDVPDGAKNLGVVRVAKVKGQSDDDTIQALREAICAKGGDGVEKGGDVVGRAPGDMISRSVAFYAHPTLGRTKMAEVVLVRRLNDAIPSACNCKCRVI